MTVKEGDKVMVRRLGAANAVPGVVTVLHDEPGHVTCEIETESGVDIESVFYKDGLKVDASWDWPKKK